MAGKLSPSTPRSKMHRGSDLEIEKTSLPGKASLHMFRENSPKILKRTPLSRGAELSQVQEELAKTKEQLALMEKSKSNLLQDLARSRRQVEELASKLQDATKVSEEDRMRAEEMEHASFTEAEGWQIELESVKEQYEAAVVELESNREEMDGLKHELMMSTEARNEAVRLAGEAMNAAETTAKRVEELSAELIAVRKARVIAVEPVETDEVKREICSPNGNVVCGCESTQDMALLLGVKETELEAAFQETNLVRAELEQLRGELALAQASCSEHAQGSALLLKAKESELESALRESNKARSELEASKREFALARAASEECVQRNHFLLAAKEIELDKALQDADRARAELEVVNQQLSVSQELRAQHMAMSSTLEQLQKQLVSLKESKIKSEMELQCLTSELGYLTDAMADSRENERRLTSELAEMSAANEQIILELANLKKDKDEALVAASNAHAAYSNCNSELVRFKESESATAESMSKLSFELEEVQEKLCRATLEETLLLSLLDILKTDLGKSHEQLETLQLKELSTDSKVQMLSMELSNLTQAHNKDVALLNSRITTSEAALQALRTNYESQNLNLKGLIEKESAAHACIGDLNLKLEQALNEAIELRRQNLSASERVASLSMELKNTQDELTELKGKELSLTYNVGSLIDDLEAKKLEVSDLEQRVAMTEDHASSLKETLELSQSELAELKKRELSMNSKAAALSVALASVSKNTEKRLLELKEKEESANFKAVALHDELRRMGLEFENALMAAKLAKDEVTAIQKAFHITNSEMELSRQEVRDARDEAMEDKEALIGALKEAEIARDDFQKAVEEVQAAEQAANERLQQVKILEERLQMAHQEALQAKTEGDKAREFLQGAQMDAKKLCLELDEERQESSSLKQEILGLRAEVLSIKEQTSAVYEENEAAKEQIQTLRKQVEKAKLLEEDDMACKSTELRPQNALLECEASLVQYEARQKPNNANDASFSGSVLQEKFDKLKSRFEDTETRLASVTIELQASITSTERLSKELEDIKLLKESNEKAVIDVHQLLADTEKAKANMEAEIQRLLDCSKQWQGAKDAIDIPVLPEMNGRVSFECRDEKPLSDNVEELPTCEPPIGEMDGKLEKDGMMKCKEMAAMRDEVGSKEEQAFPSFKRLDSPDRDGGSLRDEGALQDESSSIPMKKKKKNLLGRLGTLLDKKKPAHQLSF